MSTGVTVDSHSGTVYYKGTVTVGGFYRLCSRVQDRTTVTSFDDYVTLYS